MENRMGIERKKEREREGKYVFLGSWANTYTDTHPGNPVFPFAL